MPGDQLGDCCSNLGEGQRGSAIVVVERGVSVYSRYKFWM